ncbi:hypothetical protein [Methylocystis sp.]|uniref:hypothetical protein n=1 Tax=Methylocystis sp. TaxID=1911079 RepID=UPI003D0AA0A2
MSIVSKSSRLKIKRANSHIDTLIKHSAPLSRDLYEIGVERARTHVLLANPDCFELTYRPKEPISQLFGCIIGDAVNNLRESLDYWITAAIIGATGATGVTGKQPNFPFHDKWEDFKATGRYRSVEKAFPDLADFIFTNVQPCRDMNLDLWAITSLCNDNKHNDFVPIVSIACVAGINATIGTNRMKDCAAGGNADKPIKLIMSNSPIAIENNFSTTADIKFPKGAVFENQPVIPTLLHLSQVTTKTIDALDRFIEPYIK